MQAKNEKASRLKIYTIYPSGDETKTLVDQWTNTVVRAGMNLGDRKKPTAFSYTAATYVNNYEGEVVELLNGNTITRTVGPQTGLSTGGLHNRLINSIPDMKNFLYNKALDRLNEKTRGQLDMSINLFQAGQIKRMLQNVHRLDELFKHSKTRIGDKNHRTLEDWLKDSGNNWLQWQYGFKPLVQDIYNAATELHRHATDGEITVSASAKLEIGNQKLSGSLYSPLNTMADVSGVQGCRFHIKLKDPGGFDISRWSSLNPASIAWELLPYSFVVDWVYDVGSTLRSLETALLYGSRFVSGYYTEMWAWKGSHAVNGVATNGAYRTLFRNVRSDSKYVRFSRVPLGSYPFPRMPTFKIQLGSERLLSAASLLSQNISESKREKVLRKKIFVP